MKNDDRLRERSTGAAARLSYGQRLCFLRVVLEAHSGGVFEEGAVVCYRTNDKEEIQISRSSVRSYFQQHPSGAWELQIPEDPVAKASHRWPIDFVTSGFVRGRWQ